MVPDSLMHQEMEDNEGTLYFDGAFKRTINKGSVAMCLLIIKIEVWFGNKELEEVKTYNDVEYANLWFGLKEYLNRGVKRPIIKGDALLIIKQVQGTWMVNKDSTKRWFRSIKDLLQRFEAYQIWHISKNKNGRAHELAEEILHQSIALRIIRGCKPMFNIHLTCKLSNYFVFELFVQTKTCSLPFLKLSW